MSQVSEQFSFFPDTTERLALENASIQDLAEVFQRQKYLIVRFMHQLLISGREEDLNQIISMLAPETVDIRMITDEVITSGGMMRSVLRRSKEESDLFVGTIYPYLEKIFGSYPLLLTDFIIIIDTLTDLLNSSDNE